MASVVGDLGNFLLDAFDGVLGAEPQGEAERRDAVVCGNVMAGACSAVLWLLHYALIGPVDFVTMVAFVFLASPLVLAAWVRGGGELRHGEAGSAFCLSGFVTFAALFSGGL